MKASSSFHPAAIGSPIPSMFWPGVRVLGYGPTVQSSYSLQHPGLSKRHRRHGHVHRFPPPDPRQRPTFHVPFPPPGTVPPNTNIADANSGTFYSAMSNIDFEIGDGNPAAVAIRFHVAQHAFLSHMDFHIGSGLAALTEDRQRSRRPPFLWRPLRHSHRQNFACLAIHALDSTFEGQRESAIREHEAGLTLIRDTFRNVPTAIDIDPHYSDEFWVEGLPLRKYLRPPSLSATKKARSPKSVLKTPSSKRPHLCSSSRKRQENRRQRNRSTVSTLSITAYSSRRRNDGHHRHALSSRAPRARCPRLSTRHPASATHLRLGQRSHLGVTGDGKPTTPPPFKMPSPPIAFSTFPAATI